MDLEKEIFKGKKISDLVEEIYNKQQEQESILKGEIDKIVAFITNAGDAIVLTPILVDLIDSNSKNNDILIKILNLFKETGIAKKAEEESSTLSEKEIQQLFDEVHSMHSQKVSPKQIIG
jgi:hypothetical protein